MEANKDEAAKCFKIGKTAFSRHEYQKALKMATKAYNMFPCPEYKSFMEKCTVKMTQAEPERTTETQSTTNEESRSTTDSTNRTATDEQERLCRKIVNSRDYYEMLDVTREDSVEKIKKNYKKLALKLHPDKNPSPLASEAFKKISTAFQCLTNPAAREEYNTYGEEGRATAQTRYQEEFVTPEQLFEAFFGVNRQNNIFHYTTTSTHRSQQNTNISFVQLLPLIVLIVMVLAMNLFSHRPDAYKYEKTSKYNKKMSTDMNGVVYYVDPRRFEYDYPERTQERLELEYEIDYKYFQNKCDMKKRENKRLIDYYMSTRKSPPPELYELPKSCKILSNLRRDYTKAMRSFEF